jgi:hypothetical protein
MYRKNPAGTEVLVAFERSILQLKVLLASSEFLLRGEISLAHTSYLKYSTTGTFFAGVSGKIIHVFSSSTLNPYVDFWDIRIRLHLYRGVVMIPF